jgi:hypothetical protein
MPNNGHSGEQVSCRTNAAGAAKYKNKFGGRLSAPRNAGLGRSFRPRRLLLHNLRLSRRREPPHATPHCRPAFKGHEGGGRAQRRAGLHQPRTAVRLPTQWRGDKRPVAAWRGESAGPKHAITAEWKWTLRLHARRRWREDIGRRGGRGTRARQPDQAGVEFTTRWGRQVSSPGCAAEVRVRAPTTMSHPSI